MRKVVFEIGISLDGFIEGPNGELDWLVYDDQAFSDFAERYDTVFYGRIAYEKFGIYRSSDVQSEFEYEFNNVTGSMRKFVFSHKLKHVAGNGMVVNNNIEAHVKHIIHEDGKNILLCGGPDILTTFIDLGLVDEYILTLHPKILGSGKPLFKRKADYLNLQLLQTRKLLSGLAMLYYQPRSRTNKYMYDRSV